MVIPLPQMTSKFFKFSAQFLSSGKGDADQGDPIGGDIEEILGPDILGDPLSGDAGCFQLLEQAGGGFFALVFEVVCRVDLVVVKDADFRAAEFAPMELVPISCRCPVLIIPCFNIGFRLIFSYPVFLNNPKLPLDIFLSQGNQ